MIRRVRLVLAPALALWLSTSGCAPCRSRCGPCAEVVPGPAPSAPKADPDLERLVGWMTGEFSSTAQAKADPEYRDIRLVMARVWRERADGPWLYVEQAVAAMRERPYRQRVYRVRHVGGDLFESRVYQLKDPAKAVGAWKQPVPLAGLSPEDIVELEGCAVLLRRVDAAAFRGSTLGSSCRNAFGGAEYATSEVTVTAEGIRSWDRGYDAKAEQVWGATKGGYEFRRVPAETAAPAAK
jgi:hypothetical protein